MRTIANMTESDEIIMVILFFLALIGFLGIMVMFCF